MNKDNKQMAPKAIRSVKRLLIDSTVPLSTSFSVKQFYADQTNIGYMTSDEMMSYINVQNTSPHGITYTEILFGNIQNGFKIISPILPKIDKAGNEYAWIVFNPGAPTKAILLYGIEAFITDVQQGKIKPDFDFYDLIEEAQRLQDLKDNL